MDAALLVACLSLALAAASMTWQIATWHLDGRRVRVTLLHGLVSGRGVSSGPVGADGRPRDLSSLRSQGIRGTEVVGVGVTNIGRAPARIDRFSIARTDGELSYNVIGEAIGPSLPHRLEPGETASWFVDADAARRLAAMTAGTVRRQRDGVRAVIELGTGDEKRTRRAILLGAPR